eukprot:CAMPEP_0116858632 /NCGR_PEP_ID=MMETSP0418-20121206/21291_1 /TAXON_ID=1158023 /ORGANISM="Astrosyne radiata, Strain 13vi08-1A" /LENGTH=64 /DNA_ID=CAMNT_0004492597 /DNA_START=25 /DNA_END=215 /DNA_ORIENTATION=+
MRPASASSAPPAAGVGLACPPTPILLRHITKRDWDKARTRLALYPWDAYYYDTGRNMTTLLHFA